MSSKISKNPLWGGVLVVFLLVRSCFLITLIKCLKDRSKCICHRLCRYLCICLFVGHVISPYHSDQMSEMSWATILL